MEKISDKYQLFVDKMKEFEGFSDVPYLCPTGYPTIGYGHLILNEEASTLVRLSRRDAEVLLIADLQKRFQPVVDLLPGIDAYPHRLDAMVSWGFNLGLGALESSTMRKRYLAGDIPGTAQQMVRWVHGHVRGVKVVLPGLVRRRQWEQTLFLHGQY